MKHILSFLAFSAPLWALAQSPFRDLNEAEMKSAISLLQNEPKFSKEMRIAYLGTQEPAKASVLGNAPIPRQAFAIVYEPKKNQVFETTIDLGPMKIASIALKKGVQPPVLMEEFSLIPQIAKADPAWQAAIKKRGLSPDEVFVDGWGPGLLTPEEIKSGARILRGISYYQPKGKENPYARPIEGLIVSIDMNKKKVSSIWDTERVALAEGFQEYQSERAASGIRKPLKPLIVKQPDGPSFSLDGNTVEWMNWKLEFRIDQMKGIILHRVEHFDQGKWRSILYKAHLAEMVVPYGDPDRTWAFRNAFDVGEYGLGKTLHTLKEGLDVPENAVFMDALFANEDGSLLKIENAAALYERSPGVMWKHMDANTRVTKGMDARELVLTCTTTIGNYDYGLSWIFGEDGMIELQAHLTGILLAKGTEITKAPCENGCIPLVEGRVLAPPHQHFFNFRLDLDIDGAANTPVEMNSMALPKGRNNPFGNAFEIVNTKFEKETFRDLNAPSARKWKFVNADKKNSLGHPVGYMLMPAETATPYLHKDSVIRKRARFAEHQMWFTRHNDTEQTAAAEYANLSKGGEGLPQYIANGESLKQADAVMWYTFGVTHHPRPEEWPVMSAHRTGFKLMPVHFFDRNPGITTILR